MRIALSKTLIFLVSAALCAGAGAANVVITNSDGLTIAIKSNSSVQFDVDGNLNLECATVSPSDNRCCVVTQSSNCSPLGSTQAPADTTPPTAPSSLAATAISASQINLSWTASTDVGGSGVSQYRIERCSGASCSGFAQITTTTNLTLNNTGLAASTSYSYRVRAADVAGNLSGYSNTATATTQSGQVADSCTITDPLIHPAGMTRVDKTWALAFSTPWACTSNCVPPPSGYPQSWSFGVPIGSNKNTFTVIPIDPAANVSVNMFWDPAQANNSIGYSSPRPALGMMISVSPCAGDLRPPNNSSSDPFLRNACRKFNNTESLVYSTSAIGPSICKLEAGTRYYINVSPVDTSDGYTFPEDTCGNSLSGCEVQLRHDRT